MIGTCVGVTLGLPTGVGVGVRVSCGGVGDGVAVSGTDVGVAVGPATAERLPVAVSKTTTTAKPLEAMNRFRTVMARTPFESSGFSLAGQTKDHNALPTGIARLPPLTYTYARKRCAPHVTPHNYQKELPHGPR